MNSTSAMHCHVGPARSIKPSALCACWNHECQLFCLVFWTLRCVLTEGLHTHMGCIPRKLVRPASPVCLTQCFLQTQQGPMCCHDCYLSYVQAPVEDKHTHNETLKLRKDVVGNQQVTSTSRTWPPAVTARIWISTAGPAVILPVGCNSHVQAVPVPGL